MTRARGKVVMLQRNKSQSQRGTLRELFLVGGSRRMSGLPTAHLLAVAFQRLLVTIEYARRAARTAALPWVGLTGRDGRSFVIAHCNDSGSG